MKKLAFLMILLTMVSVNNIIAQIREDHLQLEFTELNSWTSSGTTALSGNVSGIPLASRTKTLSSQLNPAQNFDMKISYAPDGMDNWAGWYTEQNKFNTFNFTNWQYVDVFIWFAGKVCIPSKPWIETAHKNGVKIIGSVFPNGSEMNALIQKDANGKFIAARKLIDIANYYGFDGWFFNVESSVSSSVASQFMQMLAELQATKPTGMEIHWYDAMTPSGSISYQNTLNSVNAPLMQNGTVRTSDAMFTNYWWGANQISTSVNTAGSIGRNPFEVYTGADVWPGRTGAQALFSSSPNYTWITQLFNNYGTAANAGPITSPRTSLGLFAMNLTYNSGLSNFNNDPNDYANFYKTESRIFAGDDNNAAVTDPNGTNIWKGLGYYVPVRTVINSLPFKTNFNVGQGKISATNGSVTAKDWSNMGKQDLLPSWQWAVSSVNLNTNTLRPAYNFDDAYNGGSSIKFSGTLANDVTVKLFQTKLSVASNTKFTLTYKYPTGGDTAARLALYFSDNLTTPLYFNLGTAPNTGWNTATFDLAPYAGKEIAIIAMNFNTGSTVNNYAFNLGQFNIYNGDGQPQPVGTAVPTFFNNVGYTGTSAALEIGNYTSGQLQSRGVADNSISSFKVPSGYKVTVYSDDNFTGTSSVYTTDNNNMINTGNNDVVSSMKISLDPNASFSISNQATSQFLDGAGIAVEGASTKLLNSSGNNNQKWNIVDNGQLFFKIKNKATGLVLDGGGAINNGAILKQWSDVASNNLQWNLQYVGNGYYKFINRTSGLLIDGGGNTQNGTDVKQWSNVNSPNLNWYINFSGTSAASGRASISETFTAKKDLSSKKPVYPSPAKSGENVFFLYENTEDNKNGQISIYNSFGTMLYSKEIDVMTKGENKISITLPTLQKGLYVALVSTANHKKEYKLLVD